METEKTIADTINQPRGPLGVRAGSKNLWFAVMIMTLDEALALEKALSAESQKQRKTLSRGLMLSPKNGRRIIKENSR